ncbi:MAG: hypothetical protein GY854_25650 [Deltaproteobacteria bacterium]|nr:hypothetical protein [Deltaproteobacteria bacterium]
MCRWLIPICFFLFSTAGFAQEMPSNDNPQVELEDGGPAEPSIENTAEDNSTNQLEEPVDPCKNMYCPIGSHCRVFDGVARCVCRPGFVPDSGATRRCVFKNSRANPSGWGGAKPVKKDASWGKQQVEMVLGGDLSYEFNLYLRSDFEHGTFANFMYGRFKKKRTVGSYLTVAGVLGVIVGGVLSAVGGAKESKSYLGAGMAVEGVSLFFLIPGIVQLAKGRAGMARLTPIQHSSESW